MPTSSDVNSFRFIPGSSHRAQYRNAGTQE